MEMKCLSLLCSLCSIIATTGVSLSVRELRYAVFTSGPEGDFDSSGAIPAMELAEEEIFKDSLVLDGFRLTHLPVEDTLCNRTRSLDLFFASVPQATPPVLGLLGCGCSEASEPVAELIHHWNISQVAYSSSAISLSDRQRFVNFFRTYPSPSDENFAPAILSFLQFYGWSRIMFITQEQNLFTGNYQNLFPVLERNNIITRNRMVPNSIPMLQSILTRREFFFPEDDIRIIFINTFSNIARIVLCEALRSHNIAGYPRYVWITYAWYQDEWWTSAVNDDPIRCSEDELVQLLRLSLALEIVPVPDEPNAMTDVGLTAREFFNEYAIRLNTTAAQQNNYTFTFVAPIAYDAVWSLARALNSTNTMFEWPLDEVINLTGCLDDGTDLDRFELDDFTYNHSFVGCIIRWNLAQTSFTGVSGRVSFDKNGSRIINQTTMLQYRGNSATTSQVLFGRIDRLNNYKFEYINNERNESVFPDGIPPDGTPIEVVSTFHLALVIVYDILAFLGLVYTTVCLIFNFIFRRRKIVRLTSPNLNYFIIAGCYIMYASIFIRLMPSTDETVNYVQCNLQAILITIAYCLIFGTVLVKMGRIYHIFNNPTEQKKNVLKDWHLALIVSVITGVGALIPLLGWAIPQLQAIPSLRPDEEKMIEVNELGVRIMFMVWQCTADNNSNRVNIAIFIYLALMQIAAIVLAIQTRRVKIKVLNDSKYIVAMIYIATITLLVLLVVVFVLGALINVNELLFSGALLIATTAVLSLIFIPKMVSLYRDPLGEKIFTAADHFGTVNAVGEGGPRVIRNTDARVLELEARIKELESLLRERRDRECTSTDIKRHGSMEGVADAVHHNGTAMQENDGATNNSHPVSLHVVTSTV